MHEHMKSIAYDTKFFWDILNFHAIAFYAIAFDTIALLIAYPHESHYIASLVTFMGCSRGKLGLFEDSYSSDDFNVF